MPVAKKPHVAFAEVCDSKKCVKTDLLVRGDHISFVSTEQVKRVGYHARDPQKMPSDVELPEQFILVHDTEGLVLNRCDLYVVQWKVSSRLRKNAQNGAKNAHGLSEATAKAARAYFGNDSKISSVFVHVPVGVKWKREGRVKCVRYERNDYDRPFEHPYDPPVTLYVCEDPLAWRIALPAGCIVDDRGFVRP